MRGALWRVANEQMRPATGAEIVNGYLADLRIDLKRSRGQRKIVKKKKQSRASQKTPKTLTKQHQTKKTVKSNKTQQQAELAIWMQPQPLT